MAETHRIAQLISHTVEAVNLLNARLDNKVDVSKLGQATLFGRDAPLDSMSLVSLLADLEEIIEEHFGVDVVLASPKAFSRERSPFASIGELASFADELIEERRCTDASHS